MKKIIATILIMLCCVFANAAQILWIGINENAIIDFGDGTTMSVAQWCVSLPSLDDASCIIRTDAGILTDAESGWEASYWVGLDASTDDYEGSGRYVPLWSQVYAPDDASVNTTTVYYDLGIWNQVGSTDEDWKFVTIATATSTFAELYAQNHIYETGSIDPPIEGNWMPNRYYAIPEPSTAFLALFGIGLLFKRRK